MRKHHFVFLGIFGLSVQIIPAQSILKDFSGKQTSQRTIYLEWTTKAGNMCADLSIERNFEGGAFEEVFQYNGICGESDKDQDYSHTDSIAQGGRYGYRINENNGDYSDTIFVQAFADGAVVVAYPNPAYDALNVRFNNFESTITSYTIDGLDGKSLITSSPDASFQTINIGELTPGMHHLTVYTSDRKGYALRFVRL